MLPRRASPVSLVRTATSAGAFERRDNARPGLCPKIVMIDTEDGPVTGRCTLPIVTVIVPPDSRYGETAAHTAVFACEGHSAEILRWRAMSEPERPAWERRHDA